MSLADLPWNHFNPYHHRFPDSHHFASFYPPSAPPFDFFSHGVPQLSNASHPIDMATLSPDELERFQKLSNEFEPDVQGPLVSGKESSNAIAVDYANADPTLAAKTSVCLPQSVGPMTASNVLLTRLSPSPIPLPAL